MQQSTERFGRQGLVEQEPLLLVAQGGRLTKGAMKGATMLATLQTLGVMPSY